MAFSLLCHKTLERMSWERDCKEEYDPDLDIKVVRGHSLIRADEIFEMGVCGWLGA